MEQLAGPPSTQISGYDATGRRVPQSQSPVPQDRGVPDNRMVTTCLAVKLARSGERDRSCSE